MSWIEKNITALKEIGARINTITLDDHEAWKNMGSELEDVVRDIPEEMLGLGGLLGLCREGLKAIAEKSHPDLVSLAETLSEALIAAGEYLLNYPDGEPLINEAKENLREALGLNLGEQEGNTNFNLYGMEETASLSLDELAVFLIQLEPNDLSGLSRFQKLLQGIALNGSYPALARKNLEAAGQKIEEIIEGTAPDPEVVLVEVGKLIEAAMRVVEEKKGEENALPPPDTPKEQPGEKRGDKIKLSYLSPDADHSILKEFITESSELITSAEEALLSLENNPDDLEAVSTVFRAFHTIKGTSAFLALNIVSELAHQAESLLSRVREGEIRYTGGYAELSLRSVDMIKELIQSIGDALGGKPLLKPEGYDELMRLLQDPEPAGTLEIEEIAGLSPRLGDILVAQGIVGREKLEAAAEKQRDKPLGVELLKSKTVSIKDIAQALRTQQRMKGEMPRFDSSVRVRTDRLDKLIDMVGEMVIAHSMIAQDSIKIEKGDNEIQKKIAHAGKIVRELQDLSMSMRMVPLKATFQRMARLVRDLASKGGKKVNLITEGEETEVDRNMVDLISDPLMHMVRNAVDHGIELPEEREKRGKSGEGRVKLSAYHSAGNVVVEIKDDGRGLDRENIFARARAQGLMGEGSSLTDRDAFNLLFEPGFSTVEKVTDVSGRGVGLDVVKRNITALRGKIEVESHPGRACTFKIRVPLTLAIIDGMVVRVGSERYIIPTISIVRSLQPKKEDISTVLKRGEMLSVQGKFIPLFKLARLFSIEGAQKDPTQALVVVVEDNGRQTGLLADELLGQQQIVIKSLGEALRDIMGISGGAIMADGRVGLILDVGGLVRLANEESGS